MDKWRKEGKQRGRAGAPDAAPDALDPIALLVFRVAKFPIRPPISFRSTPPAPTSPGPSPSTWDRIRYIAHRTNRRQFSISFISKLLN